MAFMQGGEGRRVGRYRLERRLGRGGMGEVWAAVLEGPAGFRKPVALKLLRPRAGPDDPEAVETLRREARIGALLSHPNLVGTYELGQADGRWFVAMELVRGPSTADLVRPGPLPPRAVLEVGVQACAGLHHAHLTGLIHRDVKPSNLLVDRTGLVKIADLGIARLSGASGPAAGTPGFMAPEQTDGAEDARADLFGLAATLYALALRRAPFGTGREATFAALSVEDRLRDPDFLGPLDGAVPGLGPVLARCLRAEPAARYPDAAALGVALRELRGVHAGTPGLLEVLGAGPDGPSATPAPPTRSTPRRPGRRPPPPPIGCGVARTRPIGSSRPCRAASGGSPCSDRAASARRASPPRSPRGCRPRSRAASCSRTPPRPPPTRACTAPSPAASASRWWPATPAPW